MYFRISPGLGPGQGRAYGRMALHGTTGAPTLVRRNERSGSFIFGREGKQQAAGRPGLATGFFFFSISFGFISLPAPES